MALLRGCGDFIRASGTGEENEALVSATQFRGLSVEGSRFRGIWEGSVITGLGFKVQGSGFMALGLRIQNSMPQP